MKAADRTRVVRANEKTSWSRGRTCTGSNEPRIQCNVHDLRGVVRQRKRRDMALHYTQVFDERLRVAEANHDFPIAEALGKVHEVNLRVSVEYRKLTTV